MSISTSLQFLADTVASELPLLRDVLSASNNYGPLFPLDYPVGVPFYNTSNNQWWYREGAYWLSVQKYRFTGNVVTTENKEVQLGAADPNYGIRITEYMVHLYVAETNNSSNYWRLELIAFSSHAITRHYMALNDTSGYAVGAWHRVANTPNLSDDANYNYFFEIVANKTGLPGMLYLFATMDYRLKVAA